MIPDGAEEHPFFKQCFKGLKGKSGEMTKGRGTMTAKQEQFGKSALTGRFSAVGTRTPQVV